MPCTEEKLKNMVSTAKKHAKVFKAKFDEKVQKAAARTPEEKDMAHERRKAKVAQAKMELHQAKARHAATNLARKLTHGHGHIHKPSAPAAAYCGNSQPVASNQGHQLVVGSQGQQPVRTAGLMTGTAVPSYPLGGHLTGYKSM